MFYSELLKLISAESPSSRLENKDLRFFNALAEGILQGLEFSWFFAVTLKREV